MKRGQMNLSFGMIFSIFLIIIFISFAFYAIIKLLDFQKHGETALFLDDFQNDINQVWQSTNRAVPVSYKVPNEIQEICIQYDGTLITQPASAGRGLTPYRIKNIDLNKTLSGENSYCISKIDGRINLILKIESGDSLVTITE